MTQRDSVCSPSPATDDTASETNARSSDVRLRRWGARAQELTADVSGPFWDPLSVPFWGPFWGPFSDPSRPPGLALRTGLGRKPNPGKGAGGRPKRRIREAKPPAKTRPTPAALASPQWRPVGSQANRRASLRPLPCPSLCPSRMQAADANERVRARRVQTCTCKTHAVRCVSCSLPLQPKTRTTYRSRYGQSAPREFSQKMQLHTTTYNKDRAPCHSTPPPPRPRPRLQPCLGVGWKKHRGRKRRRTHG